MYAHVTKRVTLSSQHCLCCSSWNQREGLLAIGGSNSLLKVLKIDNPSTAETEQWTNVTCDDPVINYNLEGHSGSVISLAWNQSFLKLVSSDENGLTIVWVMQNGNWYQDMIHNKNNSVVTDMKWSIDGKCICIAYQGGAVVVGSVEGSRLWSIDDSGVALKCVAWSPDCRSIAFLTEENQIRLWDKNGNHLKDITCHDIDNVENIEWRRIELEKTFPLLTITNIQGQIDVISVVGSSRITSISSGLHDGKSQWNPTGDILVVCGRVQNKDSNLMLHFYDKEGNKMHEVELNQEKLVAIDWESCLKLAVVSEQCIYRVRVRPPYKWMTLNSYSTIVYQSSEVGHVYFLDTKGNIRIEKSFSDVSMILGGEEFCIIIALPLECSSSTIEAVPWSAIVCDEVGNEWCQKELKIQPIHGAMNDSLAIMSDYRNVYVYIFDSLTVMNESEYSDFSLLRFSNGMERMFDIQDETLYPSKAHNTYAVKNHSSGPRITSVAATFTQVMIALQDNNIHRFLLPNLHRLNKISLQCNIPRIIEVNCDSTKFSVIDSENVLQIYELEKNSDSLVGVKSYLDSSIVHYAWAMRWSKDQSNSIVISDRYKLLEITLTEKVTKSVLLPYCDGYVSGFSNLEIHLVLLDDIMLHTDTAPINYIISLPSKHLKEVDIVAVDQLFGKSEKEQPKQLWKKLGYQALLKLDFVTAEKVFVFCEDYFGIILTARVSSLDNQKLQIAEIQKVIGHYDDAEKSFRELRRIDDELQMNVDVGAWSKVEAILQRGVTEPRVSSEAWLSVADHFVSQGQYQTAAQYYTMSKNYIPAIQNLLKCNDIGNVESIVTSLTAQSSCLKRITDILLSNGYYNLAIICQKKVNIKVAMETCISLAMWDEATILANEGGLRQELVDNANQKYQELLRKNRFVQALQICNFVGLHSDAANILSELVKRGESMMPYCIIKKVFILAVQHIERNKDKWIDLCQMSRHGQKERIDVASSIERIMKDQHGQSKQHIRDVEILKNSWQKAAGWHYFLIAHRHLYNDDMEYAMKAAIHCCSYKDTLVPVRVFSLIAITSYLSGYLAICSHALTRLRSMDIIDKETDSSLVALEYAIFTKQKPHNKKELSPCYMQCLEIGKFYNACSITGMNVANERALQCKVCSFYMLEKEAQGRHSCALCHSDYKNAEVVTILD